MLVIVIILYGYDSDLIKNHLLYAYDSEFDKVNDKVNDKENGFSEYLNQYHFLILLNL